MTNCEKVLEAAKKVQEDVGDVTILVNNAGVAFIRKLLDTTEKEIRMTFEVNVLAQFWLLQAFLPKMIANDKGHIVAISSMIALRGFPNMVAYSSSKFAVRGLQDALFEELRASGSNVSQIFI